VAHDVFISYSSKDKTVADAVCATLEARGIRCWIASRDARHGLQYGEEIIDAILASRVMVLVFSSHANESKHVPNEIEQAVSHGITVVPFRIEDVLPGKKLQLFIASVHWLDAFTRPLKLHLDRLAESILRLLPDLPVREPLTITRTVVPPPPRRNLVPIAVAAIALAVSAVLGWLLWSRGGEERRTDTTVVDGQGITGGRDSAAGGQPPGGSTPAAGGIAGCWQWSTNVTVVIRPDGTMTAGPFMGQWQGSGRSYTFTWPEPVDTLTMSADRRRLSGSNQFGVQVVANRVAGGPDFPGTWMWGGVASVVADAGGSVTLGTLKGSWVLADPARRVYRVTWPKIQDVVTLSEDFNRLQGGNQYGVSVSGTRLPSCG
jgi:hypothetical protein